ncbi:MAG: UTP--glucose-1-phosphate uridylyltransferase [Fibrobacter sp.]|nr:UTP--glucose-1-phosphate uridylyltransferase [Fibrobacter sp.]
MKIELFIKKMKEYQLPQAAIASFAHYYSLFVNGNTGFIPENEITPVQKDEIDRLADLNHYYNTGNKSLESTVIIKLNGGLGTTMGLKGPKSLIPVKDSLHFLDITALQIRKLNSGNRSRIPLLLMNSFKTENECRSELQKYPDIKTDLPVSFIQHKFPRIDVSTLAPVVYPRNPLLEWNPPGHGDLYTALLTSGILEILLKKGYKYAFVSNIDNLGANLDSSILGYFAENNYSFLMEVTDRTWMDRKGGHLARLNDGRLILREAAQCPDEEMDKFKDISRHCYFNTNNLWINLVSLYDLMNHKNSILELPMIRNRKRIDPSSSDSPEVFQLESAMGSAISVFENAAAVRVPRSRFTPVKNCEELLLLWSDYYLLTDDYKIVLNPERKSSHVQINLDPLYYSRIDLLNERFPFGAPSLLECDSLTLKGDIRFGKNVRIIGNISISNSNSKPIFIKDNSVINNDITN